MTQWGQISHLKFLKFFILTSLELLILSALEQRCVVNVKWRWPDPGPLSRVSLPRVLLLHLRSQSLNVRMLLLDDFVPWEQDEVLSVEERVEQADEAAQVVQVNGLEFESVVLLDIEETQLEIIQGLLEGICALLLFLVELLSHQLVSRIF